MTPQPNPIPDFTRFRKIRAVECRHHSGDYAFEPEINECLSHGWSMLLVQPGESFATVFLGWERVEEPPKTRQQERSEAYAQRAGGKW